MPKSFRERDALFSVSVISTVPTEFKGIHSFIHLFFALQTFNTWKELRIQQTNDRTKSPFPENRGILYKQEDTVSQPFVRRATLTDNVQSGSGMAGEGLQLVNSLQPRYRKYANKIGPNILTSCRGNSLSSLSLMKYQFC